MLETLSQASLKHFLTGFPQSCLTPGQTPVQLWYVPSTSLSVTLGRRLRKNDFFLCGCFSLQHWNRAKKHRLFILKQVVWERWMWTSCVSGLGFIFPIQSCWRQQSNQHKLVVCLLAMFYDLTLKLNVCKCLKKTCLSSVQRSLQEEDRRKECSHPLLIVGFI